MVVTDPPTPEPVLFPADHIGPGEERILIEAAGVKDGGVEDSVDEMGDVVGALAAEKAHHHDAV